MIEELIIFGVYPNLVASVGMFGVFLGVTFMIFTKERRNLRYDAVKDEGYYVDLDAYACEAN